MEIKKVAILGSGKMAAEVFKLLLSSDYEVVLWARREEVVRDLEQSLKKKLRRKAKRSKEAEARLEKLHVTSDLDAIGDADLIIETIIEQFRPKLALYEQVISIIKPDAILVTNTSSLSPTGLSRRLTHQEHFAGLHFFYPTTLLSFIEVIPAQKTTPAVLETLRNFVLSLNKRPIMLTKENSAHVVNRMLAGYYNEALRIVGEGHWLPGEVDAAAKTFALIGPCESVDQIGVELFLNGVESSDEAWGEKEHVRLHERANRPWPHLYYRLREDGRVGQACGIGLFRHDNGLLLDDPDYFGRICVELDDYHRHPMFDATIVAQRLLYSIILEAARLDAHGVASRDDIDHGVKEVVGMDLGPFAYLEKIGLETARAQLKDLEERFGPPFAPIGILT